ncbi:MAG TPA: hypothetical protein VF163_07820 [Micromonosporaceae bacterium]
MSVRGWANVAAQHPALTSPPQSDPTQTNPAQTNPAQTNPAQTDPAQINPAQINPAGPTGGGSPGPANPTDPLTPIRAILATMAGRPGLPAVDGLAPGLTVTGADGWLPATELISGDALADLLATAQRRWQASPHVAAAVAWKYYTYWVALPAVIGFAAARRVPDLRPSNVVTKWSVHGRFLTVGLAAPSVAVLPTDPLAASARPMPTDPLAASAGPRPGVRVVPDETAALDVLRQWLLAEHLDPLLDNLRRGLRLGRRTLWGSVASGVAHGVSRAAVALADPALSVASRILTALDLADLVELTPATDGGPGLDVQRKTCCLAFALPEPRICAGCCIR